MKLDWDSICFSICVGIVSQFEKHPPYFMDIPEFGLTMQTYTYIYNCREGIRINVLSCKTSYWHFGDSVSFEKISLKFFCGKMLKYIYNSILTLSQLHCQGINQTFPIEVSWVLSQLSLSNISKSHEIEK